MNTYNLCVEEFKDFLRDAGLDSIDIHKDNPTLLYYNDSRSI